MKLITEYMTQNPCYKSGRSIQVKGLMLHSVGCPQPNPEVFIRKWNDPSYDRACVHGFIGGNDVHITLPCMAPTGTSGPGKAHRGWHCGKGSKGSANNTHIGIEMCEPASIRYTGGASFTVSDRTSAVAFVKKTTESAVELFAQLCKYHHLDPLKDGVIISHCEGHSRGVASNHGDPDHLWRGLGMNYTMDNFRKDVYQKMNQSKEDPDMDMDEFKKMFTDMRKEFQDNDCGSWSEEARQWAIENKLIAGAGPGTDGKPNYMWGDMLTREQAVQLFYNFAKLMGRA